MANKSLPAVSKLGHKYRHANERQFNDHHMSYSLNAEGSKGQKEKTLWPAILEKRQRRKTKCDHNTQNSSSDANQSKLHNSCRLKDRFRMTDIGRSRKWERERERKQRFVSVWMKMGVCWGVSWTKFVCGRWEMRLKSDTKNPLTTDRNEACRQFDLR